MAKKRSYNTTPKYPAVQSWLEKHPEDAQLSANKLVQKLVANGMEVSPAVVSKVLRQLRVSKPETSENQESGEEVVQLRKRVRKLKALIQGLVALTLEE